MASSVCIKPPFLYSSEDTLIGFSEVKSLSRVRLFVTPWTVAYQAPPFMGFSRQECWSGLPFPSPGDLPDPGIEPRSPTFRADALPSPIKSHKPPTIVLQAFCLSDLIP